jgi:hypothetical protein
MVVIVSLPMIGNAAAIQPPTQLGVSTVRLVEIASDTEK